MIIHADCKKCGEHFHYERKEGVHSGALRKYCDEHTRKQYAAPSKLPAFRRFDKKAITLKRIADTHRRECSYCGVVFIACLTRLKRGKMRTLGRHAQTMCGKGCSTKAAADAAREKIARISAGVEPMPVARAAYIERQHVRGLVIREVAALNRIGARNKEPATANCEVCGSIFKPRTKKHSCCSLECRNEKNRDSRRESDWLRRRGKALECTECGTVFSPLNGNMGRTVCGDDCERIRERRAKNNSKRKRRATIRGVAAEFIDSNTVFKRDGWKCCCCGDDLPRSLVGSGADNEPTIDHIVPLAMGGKHTYENVQLLCRLCNTLKGEKPWARFLAEYGCADMSHAWFDLKFHLPLFGHAQRPRPEDYGRMLNSLDIVSRIQSRKLNGINDIPGAPQR